MTYTAECATQIHQRIYMAARLSIFFGSMARLTASDLVLVLNSAGLWKYADRLQLRLEPQLCGSIC